MLVLRANCRAQQTGLSIPCLLKRQSRRSSLAYTVLLFGLALGFISGQYVYFAVNPIQLGRPSSQQQLEVFGHKAGTQRGLQELQSGQLHKILQQVLAHS